MLKVTFGLYSNPTRKLVLTNCYRNLVAFEEKVYTAWVKRHICFVQRLRFFFRIWKKSPTPKLFWIFSRLFLVSKPHLLGIGAKEISDQWDLEIVRYFECMFLLLLFLLNCHFVRIIFIIGSYIFMIYKWLLGHTNLILV